jgi:hypothetical protein
LIAYDVSVSERSFEIGWIIPLSFLYDFYPLSQGTLRAVMALNSAIVCMPTITTRLIFPFWEVD